MTGAGMRAARQGELPTASSVDVLPAELSTPDDNARAPQGGKLLSELLREYLKDRDGETSIEPSGEPT
jgi:hypothetical protein